MLLDHTYDGFKPSNRGIQSQGELQSFCSKKSTVPVRPGAFPLGVGGPGGGFFSYETQFISLFWPEGFSLKKTILTTLGSGVTFSIGTALKTKNM